MPAELTPEISMILVTPRDYSTLAATMSHLRSQTIHDKIEVLILAPSAPAVKLDPRDREALLGVRVLEVSPGGTLSSARAAGVRAARAPYVALAEDHCFPSPRLAETYVRRHREGYAVVGPEIVNANPKSAMSWTAFLMAYGPWVQPAPAGEADFAPGHNSCYRRELLLAFGEELDVLLGAEIVLHWELRAAGHKILIDPQAKCVHLNVSRLWPFILGTYHHSRVFAAARARHWVPGRRAFYTLASPLIPLVRLRRMITLARQRLRGRISVGKMLPYITICLLANGAGEAVGYATGAGDSDRHDWEHELDRSEFLLEEDRDVLVPPSAPRG